MKKSIVHQILILTSATLLARTLYDFFLQPAIAKAFGPPKGSP
jgi:hypothetical protein